MATTSYDIVAEKLQAARRNHIMQLQTKAGGWKRKDLASLGINWPPKKGWKECYINGDNPNIDDNEFTEGKYL